MLSRTADHLYWMSRYTERAENIARMLDVNNRMSLLPQAGEVVGQSWTATLSITGLLAAYQERKGAVTPEAALHFMAFDRENSSSIYSCLRASSQVELSVSQISAVSVSRTARAFSRAARRQL